MSSTITIHPGQAPLKAEIPAPGSKSYTNRALIMAALAGGTSTLELASSSTDSEVLIAALKKLGVEITHSDSTPSSITVRSPAKLKAFKGEIDVGAAGTSMRFLTALCATVPGIEVVLRGSERMHQRPISQLVDALITLGAQIDYLGTVGCPPLLVRTTQSLKGGIVAIDGSVSSQFISSILMIAPQLTGDLTLKILEKQISQPYLAMTIQSMAEFGVQILTPKSNTFFCQANQRYTSRDYQVEGDASSATYLWGLAAVTGGDVTVSNINPQSAQGDLKFVKLLEEMGCKVTIGERSIRVVGPDPKDPSSRLHAINADMESMPDAAQTLAVVAACADGETTITGLSTLRVKETDRIAALHAELAKVGIASFPTPDTIKVQGGNPKHAIIATYEDHRMAMAFSLLGAKSNGITIEHPNVVNKSFPDYWDVLRGMGLKIS